MPIIGYASYMSRYPTLNKLRAVRTARSLNQVELANLSGVSQPSISRLEHGWPAYPGAIRKLAKALNWPEAELL